MATVAQLAEDLQDPGLPPEINRLGRTLWRWRTQISNWHTTAWVTNAATEAANNLIKRVKRAAFGFTNFNNYRIRSLLYAGKPWASPRIVETSSMRRRYVTSTTQVRSGVQGRCCADRPGDAKADL